MTGGINAYNGTTGPYRAPSTGGKGSASGTGSAGGAGSAGSAGSFGNTVTGSAIGSFGDIDLSSYKMDSSFYKIDSMLLPEPEDPSKPQILPGKLTPEQIEKLFPKNK